MSDSLVDLIIREEFGDKFAKVVDIILQNGEIRLAEIVSESGFKFAEIK